MLTSEKTSRDVIRVSNSFPLMSGVSASTIGEEKRFNPRLTKSKKEFIEIMANLNLDKPNLIGIGIVNKKSIINSFF